MLEFGDELSSSAAVTLMEAKSGYPQLSTDFGGAGTPPSKKPIRISGLRSPQRQLLYPSKASKTFLCPRPSFPCPQLCPTAPRRVLTLLPLRAAVARGVTAATPQPSPAQAEPPRGEPGQRTLVPASGVAPGVGREGAGTRLSGDTAELSRGQGLS